MANEIATIQSRLPMPQNEELEAGIWRVLCESIFPNAKSSASIVMAINYCKARKLDIMKRPVNIVPMWNSSLGQEVETVWPGINEVQITAARTGRYAGMDEPKWGQDKNESFKGNRKWKDKGVWKEEEMDFSVTYPEWCSVTVYRLVDGQRCAFTEPVFWKEAYAKAGKTDCPNAMWAKRPKGQLLKVAKAFSLRAAFPEEGELVAEEMEGKEIAAGGVVIENITPAPATEIFKPSIFKNASLRNSFLTTLIRDFESASAEDELEFYLIDAKKKLDDMRASGNEHDLLGAEEIDRRYQWALKAIQKRESEKDNISASHGQGFVDKPIVENKKEPEIKSPVPENQKPAFMRKPDHATAAPVKPVNKEEIPGYFTEEIPR